MSEYNFFFQDPTQWGDALQSIWGCHDICPLLRIFHTASITQSELSSLTSLKAWGNPEKVKSKVTLLLLLTSGCTEGDKVFGLSTIWVHPYQARVPTIGRHLNCWPCYPPLGLTVLIPWCSLMGMPTLHHSPRRDSWASKLWEAPAAPPAGESVNYRSTNSSALVPR